MDSGITPVMNVGGYGGYGYGNGSAFGGEWIFGLIVLAALFNGGFGGYGRGAYGTGFEGRCATVEDLNNSANFTRLESQVQGIGSAIAQQNTNLSNAICTLGYQSAVDFGALSKQVSDCCCANERIALENRYLAAQNTAAINANTTAAVQSIKDMLTADKAAAQAARIADLELDRKLCGIVRYPTTSTYSAGYPFTGFGYGNSGCSCGSF